MKKKPVNKSEFIRGYPNLSAKALKDLAAKRGLSITPNMVYSVRSDAKKRSSTASISSEFLMKGELQKDLLSGQSIEELLKEYAARIRAAVIKEITAKIGAMR